MKTTFDCVFNDKPASDTFPVLKRYKGLVKLSVLFLSETHGFRIDPDSEFHGRFETWLPAGNPEWETVHGNVTIRFEG